MKGVMKVDNFSVTSPAFKNGEYIPIKYSGIGENISIPLAFHNIDPRGKSIAIIMDDPDAPTPKPFVHWLIWNIPTSITSIPEDIPPSEIVLTLDGALQGKNTTGEVGYIGPNPPSGTHVYKIKAYVLDYFLDIEAGSTKEELEKEMEGHILQSSLLEGKFSHQE
jgi:Raf kinase inhibitor-like YbhB/YbcL family protein